MFDHSKKITLSSLEITDTLGRRLGRISTPGDVITLGGALGAGKTTLTKSIGLGLGTPDSCCITSPTFSLLHEYPGRIPLYHMDFYRLSGEEEIYAAGLDEYLFGDGLAVVEWPDRLGGLLPDNRLHIELFLISESARSALLTAFGNVWQGRLSSLVSVFI